MLAVLGFGTLITFMVTVMRKWATAFVAIIAAPVIFAIIAGFGPQLGEFTLAGIETVAPTAVLLLFAVLYFGLMMDAKLFDPISRFILRISKGDPLKIIVGTAVMALLLALDGDGTTTYMLICSAFLPIYRRLGINPLIIATIAVMALGLISGSTPWGGAATRAIAVLHLDPTEYFLAMIPSLALTSLFILAVAFYFGLRARRTVDKADTEAVRIDFENEVVEKAGWKIWFNAILTILLLVLLVAGIAPLVVLFIGGFVIALVVNYPKFADQAEVAKKHAASAVPVVMLVLAAGVFTGVLTESGMIEAMADTVLMAVPQELGEFIPLITALVGIPLSFFMANDAYFFGVLPVLAGSAEAYGVSAMEIARAGVIGQMAHMIGPASAPLWVLLGLLKVELADLHKHSILWIILASLVFVLFAVITGAVSVPFL